MEEIVVNEKLRKNLVEMQKSIVEIQQRISLIGNVILDQSGETWKKFKFIEDFSRLIEVKEEG